MVAIDRIAAATQSDRINPLYSPDGVNVHPIGSFSPGKPDPWTASRSMQLFLRDSHVPTIRYDTRCYFNVRSKADMSQLNLPHGTDN